MPAHAFDTGALRAGRTLLRDAIVQRLGELSKAAGLYLAGVIAIPMPFRDDDTLQHMLSTYVNGRSPVVLVALGDSTSVSGGAGYGNEWTRDVEVHVYVLSSHAGGTLVRMTGDATSLLSLSADPGIEVMDEHVYERLAGWRPSLPAIGAKELRPVGQAPIYFGEDYTVWEQKYAVKMRGDVNRLRGLTQLLLGVDASHNSDEAVVTTETDITP